MSWHAFLGKMAKSLATLCLVLLISSTLAVSFASQRCLGLLGVRARWPCQRLRGWAAGMRMCASSHYRLACAGIRSLGTILGGCGGQQAHCAHAAGAANWHVWVHHWCDSQLAAGIPH